MFDVDSDMETIKAFTVEAQNQDINIQLKSNQLKAHDSQKR